MPVGRERSQRTIVLWTAPRCISTAFERAIVERGDCRVLHEPFARPYYFGPEAVSTRYEDDERTSDTFKSVAAEVYDTNTCDMMPTFSSTGGPDTPVFVKDMAYYVHGPCFDQEKEDMCFPVDHGSSTVHTFLIRHPAKTIRSLYLKSCVDNAVTGWKGFNPDEAGFAALHALWKRASAGTDDPVVVVDADDLLISPEPLLEAYCDAVGLSPTPKLDKPADWKMSRWEPGPVPGWDLWPGWHDDAINSSGIISSLRRKPPPSQADLPDCVRECIAEAMPLYEEMYASRLQVALLQPPVGVVSATGEGSCEKMDSGDRSATR